MLTNSAKAAGSPTNPAMGATGDNSSGSRQSTRPRKQTERYGHEASASSSSGHIFLEEEEDNYVQDEPAATPERRIASCRFASASGKNRFRALLQGPAATPERRIANCRFVSASGKDKLRVLLQGAQMTPAPASPPESSKDTSKKRKSPSSNAPDLDGSESATGIADNAPKKQRKQTAKEKAEARVAAANVQEFLPAPRGQPEVWAEDRQSLCESLPWFQSVKSGTYHYKGFGYGWLLDNDNDERGYMDDEIVISRL